MLSFDNIARYAFENEKFVVKLHPIIDDKQLAPLTSVIGWDRIIAGDVSGVALLSRCKTAYVHTGSELATMAVVLGKNIVNISKFSDESIGSYYPMNSILFRSDDKLVELNNMLDCKFSGLIMPWMDDKEERIKAFYDKSLEIRENLKPLSSARATK